MASAFRYIGDTNIFLLVADFRTLSKYAGKRSRFLKCTEITSGNQHYLYPRFSFYIIINIQYTPILTTLCISIGIIPFSLLWNYRSKINPIQDVDGIAQNSGLFEILNSSRLMLRGQKMWFCPNWNINW